MYYYFSETSCIRLYTVIRYKVIRVSYLELFGEGDGCFVVKRNRKLFTNTTSTYNCEPVFVG